MSEFKLDRVDVLVIEPNRNTSNSIKNILTTCGNPNIQIGAHELDIQQNFQLRMPDLMISEYDLRDGPLDEIIKNIREGDYGTNPFLPIIGLAEPASKNVKTDFYDAGGDELIAKPITPKALLDAIENLIHSRRAFVITSQYIGPDRKENSTFSDSMAVAEPVYVPNTLQAKTKGKKEFAAVEMELGDAIKQVRRQRQQRIADKIFEQSELLSGILIMNLSLDEQGLTILDLLDDLIEEMVRRVAGTEFAHVSTLCQAMARQLKIFRDVEADFGMKEINILPPLAKSIRLAYSTSEEAQNFSQKVLESFARN
jgi:DNA-binding response OmpR family regulator